jgi:flagellar basal body rod protein FlgG
MPPRLTGLTSAAAALRYLERRQEVTAHNLANATTDGFRGERAFAQLLGDGAAAVRTATDARSGTLRETRAPLDLALAGDGYFVVQTPAGERLTRAGSFRLDADRQLVDAAGNPVLGEDGPVVLPAGADVSVGADGAVRVGQRAAGRLRLEQVDAGVQMAHEDGVHFVPDPSRRPLADADRRVRQGYVEESNVTPVGALVDMIAVQRAYAGVQKAVTTLDEVRGRAASELGKPV